MKNKKLTAMKRQSLVSPKNESNRLLALDIGNTETDIGIFRGKILEKIFSFRSEQQRTADEYGLLIGQALAEFSIQRKNLGAFVIASVVPPLTDIWVSALQRYMGLSGKVLEADDIPIVNRYRDPNQVGIDRLLNGWIARELYGSPIVVIDCGTATTFDCIDQNGAYLGGVIAPGIILARDFLYSRTAKLPLVDLKKPKTIIGQDTTSSIQIGLYWGYIGLIEGMLKLFRQELGKEIKVVVTGGLSQFLHQDLPAEYGLQPSLTLSGIARLVDERKDFLFRR